jgi:hypothetical protein
MSRVSASLAVLGLSLLIAGCPTAPRRTPDWPPATGPGPSCPPGAFPIGVLAVTKDIVFRNRVPARSGDRVCNGDHISTNFSGVGDLLFDGDHASDTIHFAENTDPRITLTPHGCINVGGYNSGHIVVTTRRCALVRTPDALILVFGGSARFEVIRNTATGVTPSSGSVTKLQQLSELEVSRLSSGELAKKAAPAPLQPKINSLTVYKNFTVVQPAEHLSPPQIQRMNRLLLPRAVVPATPPVQQPR